jgi:hypothetical protein
MIDWGWVLWLTRQTNDTVRQIKSNYFILQARRNFLDQPSLLPTSSSSSTLA